jgi:hypothetical protein
VTTRAVTITARLYLVNRLVSFLRPDPEQLLIAIEHVDGKIAVDLSTSEGALKFDLDPTDGLRVALAFKQHAEAAQAQLAEKAEAARNLEAAG